ncbi:MBOAT, membrane-bound o-acyltransferase family protein [Sarocladium implicatum]|nr:MBOAT, membrane-bound o-acyltransferase family protein [Sarocladium implicatum]
MDDEPPDQRSVSPQMKHQPVRRSLADAIHAAGINLDNGRRGSGTPSEEDYDENVRPTLIAATGMRRRKTPAQPTTNKRIHVVRRDSGVHIYPDDDDSLREFLQRSSERARGATQAHGKTKFKDMGFQSQFSVFDKYNVEAVNSQFHGFYTLFWLGIALFVLKISADNWRLYGSPLGSGKILETMFSRDVIVLLASDGAMCALTGVSWVIQRLVLRGYFRWNRSGWIVWQSTFILGVISWTLVREWPWTHTVYFVLHGITMLMKQHAYAFYNGYLSTVRARREYLLARLEELEAVSRADGPAQTEPLVTAISTSHLDVQPSAEQRRRSISKQTNSEECDIDRVAAAISSKQSLSDEQVELFERLVRWEVDALADELQGTASDPSKAYPKNLTFTDHYKWIPLPTLVYELEYPRTDSIDWSYVAEKVIAMVGIMFVMIQVSQYSIYPVVMQTIAMKETHVPLARRLAEFPWILSDLIFPFMVEYLLAWYIIWETVLNLLAELTCFGDRHFYDAWWNSVSWDQFARDWNRPVHIFLLRHVFHSSISSLKVNKHTATLITFFLSACIHELVMWCLFKKLRGYLLILQMCQLPLVQLSRTKWLKGKRTLGNIIFWIGIFTGPSLLCSLYLIL